MNLLQRPPSSSGPQTTLTLDQLAPSLGVSTIKGRFGNSLEHCTELGKALWSRFHSEESMQLWTSEGKHIGEVFSGSKCDVSCTSRWPSWHGAVKLAYSLRLLHQLPGFKWSRTLSTNHTVGFLKLPASNHKWLLSPRRVQGFRDYFPEHGSEQPSLYSHISGNPIHRHKIPFRMKT